jgi:hypothetical protein
MTMVRSFGQKCLLRSSRRILPGDGRILQHENLAKSQGVAALSSKRKAGLKNSWQSKTNWDQTFFHVSSWLSQALHRQIAGTSREPSSSAG